MVRSKRIIILGPGRMGLGIALAFALHPYEVRIVDGKERSSHDQEKVRKNVKKELSSNLRFLRRIGFLKDPIKKPLSRISLVHGLNGESLDGDFVFEAIPERPDLKIDLFKKIIPHLHRETILASTTSTIDLTTLNKSVRLPERMLITHWLNPAFIIPLVEIARTGETDPKTVDQTKHLLQRIGKTPIVLKDSPGFIIPRIQALAMNEAVRILEEGIATADDIDVAIKYGFGFRLAVFGLLEFIDMGGLDILYYADEFLYSAFKSERFKVPRLIEEKMKKGDMGPRTGRGIYDYRNKNINALFEEKYRRLITLLRMLGK